MLDGWAVQGTHSPTDSAPTKATEGLSLSGLKAFTFTAKCDAGQSFASAVGQWDVYIWSPATKSWSLYLGHEQPIPLGAVGLDHYTILFDVVSASGRVALVPNGIGLTGGGLTSILEPVKGSWP